MPRKLLKEIFSKTILQWTWESVMRAESLDDVIVACDHELLFDNVISFGGKAVMTDTVHQSGTDRIAQVACNIDADVIINVQADEPLIEPDIIDMLAGLMQSEIDMQMATVKRRLVDADEIADPNNVKVVCDENGYALYFSRSVIPYYRADTIGEKEYYKHLGIYAYKKDFLCEYSQWPQTWLEKAEKLEQLRALGAGVKIRVLETDYDAVGVDTQEDFDKVEQILKGRNIC
jgi:3-deoxy-manno-octulosonate cytidylyltransferase (CMP-KDO synthetase)